MPLINQKLNLSAHKRYILMGIAVLLVLSSVGAQAQETQVVAPAPAPAAELKLVVPTDVPSVTVAREMTVTMTAYSSAVDECDDSPFIAADGSRVYDGMVAANFLKFGTKVRIPELFGDKVFTVHDRMNKRFSDRMDVWMPTKAAGMKFGIKHNVKIEIVQ